MPSGRGSILKIRQSLGGNWEKVVAGLFLGAGFFAVGYAEGEKAATTNSEPRAAEVSQLTPPNASPVLKEFMENRAKLAQEQASLDRQNFQGAPQGLPVRFQPQNMALLQRQRELAVEIGRQNAQGPALEPPPLQIPANASAQLKAFLTTRHQLACDEMAFENQHRGDDPLTREAAIQQWLKDSAARLQQLRQEAQALSQANQDN
jgi:hypothetical protein